MSDTTEMRRELLGLTQDELREFMGELGEKPYRARQLFQAIHRRRIASFDRITDLPKTLRRILDQHAVVTFTGIENVFLSSDGTRRFLLKLSDGSEVESVFMPEQRRDTICISSQVGCPLACDFCMTGVIGLKGRSPQSLQERIPSLVNSLEAEQEEFNQFGAVLEKNSLS